MKRQPYFEWSEEFGSAACILEDNKGNTFIGSAHCHEDDFDMKSEKTGCEIAFRRAKIEFFKHIRDNEIKPALAALKQLYYSMNHSKKFNPKSYENKMLQRQIRAKEFDLDTVQNMIADEMQSLKEYLESKDKFYQAIRKNRQGQKQLKNLEDN